MMTSFPEGVRYAAEAAAAVECEVAQITKSMLFRANERLLLVVAFGSNRLDTPSLYATLNRTGSELFHVKRTMAVGCGT